MLTVKPARSPAKPSANAFEELLDQAFNSDKVKHDEKKARSASNPHNPRTNPIETKRVFSAPHDAHTRQSLDPVSLEQSSTAKTENSYLLPMIFEEDKFAASLDSEFQSADLRNHAHKSKARNPSVPYIDLNLHFDGVSAHNGMMQTLVEGTDSAVTIPGTVDSFVTANSTNSTLNPATTTNSNAMNSNAMNSTTTTTADPPHNEITLTYEPSPAAASVAKPVRQAPVPPVKAENDDENMYSSFTNTNQYDLYDPYSSSSEPSHSTPQSSVHVADTNSKSPSTQPAQQPIQVYVDDAESLKRSDSVTKPVLNEIPIPNQALTGPVVVPKQKEPYEQLVVPKNARALEPKAKEKKNWIRRLTPRLGSRKSSREQTAPAPVPKPAPVHASKPALTAKLSTPHDDKENQLARAKTVKQPEPAPTGFSEPKQNWVMKIFTNLSLPASKTVVLHHPLPEVRDHLLSTLTNWSPYGLAVRKKDAKGSKLTVTILATNSLKLKSAVIDISQKPVNKSTELVLEHKKGSRNSFHTFCNQVEKVLA